MSISLSIVSYNSPSLIKETVENLVQYFPGKIYLIDNNSQDTTVGVIKELAQKYSNVTPIFLAENIGFGRGHNKVLEQLTSDYHIICNPDIRVASDIFTGLENYMNKNSDVGLVVPQFVFPDGSLQAGNKQLPTVFDLFVRRFLPSFLKKRIQARMDWYEMRDVGYAIECDVPSVSGAFMFCRSIIFKKIGGFDSRYFMYFEDIDLGRKFRDAGYKTKYFPGEKVIHFWQRANHSSWKMTFVLIFNGIKYFNKWGWKFY